MAKALLGHVGGPDPLVVADLARLRRRVRDLEQEVVRLRATNEALAALVAEDVMLEPEGRLLTLGEPALT
ncbi:MAG: hypothetical protein MUC45_06335 [Actinomycetia bacterium]|nr:hypothetical protein [Actinomycetes bacterium]